MATIEREEIFKGSPADFEGIVSIYDSRLMMRHALKGAFCYAFDVDVSASKPIEVHSSPIGYIGRPLPPQVMPNPGQWCKINIWPAASFPVRPNAGIAAQTLPNRRSLLVLWCEEQDWPEIEPYWLELIAELRRLRCIESEEPPKSAKPATKSTKRRPGRQHQFTEQERREICEEYLSLGGGMGQNQFMSERYGMSGRTLRDWLTEFGL